MGNIAIIGMKVMAAGLREESRRMRAVWSKKMSEMRDVAVLVVVDVLGSKTKECNC
jgi:hypothetical protein